MYKISVRKNPHLYIRNSKRFWCIHAEITMLGIHTSTYKFNFLCMHKTVAPTLVTNFSPEWQQWMVLVGRHNKLQSAVKFPASASMNMDATVQYVFDKGPECNTDWNNVTYCFHLMSFFVTTKNAHNIYSAITHTYSNIHSCYTIICTYRLLIHSLHRHRMFSRFTMN